MKIWSKLLSAIIQLNTTTTNDTMSSFNNQSMSEPTTVYVFEFDNELHIRTNFGEISDLLSVAISRPDYTFEHYMESRYEMDQDGQTCMGADIEHGHRRGPMRGEYFRLLEYEFGPNEPIGFMQCQGPSLDCCFIQRKTQAQFWTEAMDYFHTTSVTTMDYEEEDEDGYPSYEPNGCNVRMTHSKNDSCSITTLAYHTAAGDETELTTFSFIQLMSPCSGVKA